MNTSSKNFNRLQIILSSSSHFVIDIYQNFIIGLIPIITVKFELSLFKVALLTATSIIANSIFSPVFGYFSDRHGLRYFLVSGMILAFVFLSFIGIISNYYILLVFLLLGNLGVAIFHPASAAVAGHYGGNRKGMGSSLINFGGIAGGALGILLFILIAEKINIRLTPFAMIPGIIMVAVLLRQVPRSNPAKKTNSEAVLFKKIRGANRNKLFILFLIIFSIYSVYILWITMITYIPLHYAQAGVTLINVGTVMLLFGMLGGAGGLLSGQLFDRFGNGNFIIQAGFFASIPFFYFTFKTTGILSMLLFIIGGIFLISIQPVCIRMTQDLLPENMSLASSLILGFGSGVAAITMIFLGKIADRIGTVQLVNYELILTGFTFLLLFFFPRTPK